LRLVEAFAGAPGEPRSSERHGLVGYIRPSSEVTDQPAYIRDCAFEIGRFGGLALCSEAARHAEQSLLYLRLLLNRSPWTSASLKRGEVARVRKTLHNWAHLRNDLTGKSRFGVLRQTRKRARPFQGHATSVHSVVRTQILKGVNRRLQLDAQRGLQVEGGRRL